MVGVFSVVILLLLLGSTRYSAVNVSLAGNNISNGETFDSLKSKIEAQTLDYMVAVEYGEKTSEYPLAEAGMQINIDSSVQNAIQTKKPDNLFRRLAFWQSSDLSLNITADSKKMDAFIKAKLTKSNKPAKNASLVIKNGKASVVKEQAGSAFSLADPQSELLDYVSLLSKDPLRLEAQSIEPALKAKEAETAKLAVESYLAKDVTFTIEGAVIKANPSDIGAWLEISPSAKTKTIDVTLNSGKVLEYINAIAAPYVSPPQNAIKLPGSGRNLVAGRNGVDVVSKETVATEVAKQMLVKDAINQTLPVQYQTYKTVSATPHDKWVAIDLSSKVMYVYEKTNLVKTILISAGAPETPTVEGTYQIGAKLASQTMTGPNADGSQYNQPNVPYVNYFFADYAIHGVYWRPDSYLGNVNASHGCVGLSVGEAAWFFGWAPVGTTVVTFS